MQIIAITRFHINMNLNFRNYPAQWIASVSADGLIDEQNRTISPFNRNLEGLRLLRVWPTWGVLDPQETLGINVYFSGEVRLNRKCRPTTIPYLRIT